jgi:hypothetical protein
MLELDLEVLDLTAIGLLTTLMPDGSQGFSLLVIIAAEFSPIQQATGSPSTASAAWLASTAA